MSITYEVPVRHISAETEAPTITGVITKRRSGSNIKGTHIALKIQNAVAGSGFELVDINCNLLQYDRELTAGCNIIAPHFSMEIHLGTTTDIDYFDIIQLGEYEGR